MVRKARKKKGGGPFMDKMTQGASQWKQGIQTGTTKIKEKAAEAQAGIASGQQAYNTRKQTEKIKRQMVAGEYSQMAKELLSKTVDPESTAYQVQKQLEAKERGESTASFPNPNLTPMKRKRAGGKRRKTRRKSRKRKTKRKKRKGGWPKPTMFDDRTKAIDPRCNDKKTGQPRPGWKWVKGHGLAESRCQHYSERASIIHDPFAAAGLAYKEKKAQVFGRSFGGKRKTKRRRKRRKRRKTRRRR